MDGLPAHDRHDLGRIYAARFTPHLAYRQHVWRVLIEGWFGQYLRGNDRVLDLGCGYGEFINQVQARERFAMDLNPDARSLLNPSVQFLEQDCATAWPLAQRSLDVVFTSNFLEHLPDKAAVGRTLDEVRRCLRPGGLFIAMGPNVRYLPGAYWDFWDHYVPLSDASLREALVTRGFSMRAVVPRFLPYTMASGPRYPLLLLRGYLRFPWAWRLFGKQFLIVAARSDG